MKTTNIELELQPDTHELGTMLFRTPRFRPAVFEEIYPDAEHVIDKIAKTYTDVSCPELSYEDLQAEGRRRLAILVDRGFLAKTETRVGFFKCFTTSLKRAVCSLVQKYRFTEKRTGVKPPGRNERFTGEHRMKTVEVHSDDPEAGIQVPDVHDGGHGSSFVEILEEFSHPLSDLEKLVLNQLASPNPLSWAHAYVESRRGRGENAPVQIKIKHESLAYGLGMPPRLFSECVLSIQLKIKALRDMSNDQRDGMARRNAALTQLAKLFNLQIPPVDDIVVRRMFTFAARDQFEKVDDGVRELLQEIGAVVPVLMGGELACYGVLHSRNAPRCVSCDIQKACAVKCASVGLDEITPSPELIGSRNVRIPVVSSKIPSADTPRDMEIMSYLDENFERGTPRGRLAFRHRDGGAQYIIGIGKARGGLVYKFVGASEALRERLALTGRAYVAPADKSASDIIGMIEQHARETLHG